MEEIFVDENGRKFKLGPPIPFDNSNPEHKNPDKFEFIKGDVWTHTMLVLDKVREQSDNVNFLWAALLHDIGKPGTAGINSCGDINNHGHDKLGAEMALEIMTRLKASVKDRRNFCYCW